MTMLVLLAQAEPFNLPADAPWWGFIVAACIWAIINLINRRVAERTDSIKVDNEAKLAKLRSEIDDRGQDSKRQDDMLKMISSLVATTGELIIKINASNEAISKEREALLAVVTANSGATHHAARQVEQNTQVLLSVSEIVEALKSQLSRSPAQDQNTAELTLKYLTRGIEALLRDRIMQLQVSPGYNTEDIQHLSRALDALRSAELQPVNTETEGVLNE